MKKGGGTGPVKPWQPPFRREGAKSDSDLLRRTGRDKLLVVLNYFPYFIV